MELPLYAASLALHFIFASIFLLKSDNREVNVPLGLFFLSFAAPGILHILKQYPDIQHFDEYRIVLVSIEYTARFIVPQCFWWFLSRLTRPSSERLGTRFFAVHFAPLILVGLPLSLGFGLGILPRIPDLLLWFPILLATAYGIGVIARLLKYQSRLSEIFASTRIQEVSWILWLSALYLVLSVFMLAPLFNQQLPYLSRSALIVIDMIWLWGLAIWAMRMMHFYDAAQVPAVRPKNKYGRAVLSFEERFVIAQKIETLMAQQKPYLDPLLTLYALAAPLKIPANDVSQTLNDHLNMSFHDYVNMWRVKETLPQILRGEKKILSIALDAGFNSQSTFYKAFKKVMKMTPRAYRKSVLTNT